MSESVINIWDVDTPYSYAMNKMIKIDSEECENFTKILNESHKAYVELNHLIDIFKIDKNVFAKYNLLTTVYNKKIFDNCHLYLNKDDEKYVTKEIKQLDFNLSKVINLGYSYYIDNELKRIVDSSTSKSNKDAYFLIIMVNVLLLLVTH